MQERTSLSDGVIKDGGIQARQRAQAAAFDRIGARYDEIFPHRDGQWQAIELLLERLPGGARVLDVGCGTGVPTARQLVDAGCAVTGLDISPGMLDLARGNVPAATFLARDALAVDDTLGRFDAVVAFFSLLMLPRAQIVEVLGRFRAVLPSGGWLVVGMVEADLDDAELPFLGQPIRVTGWPRDVLRQVLGTAGFVVESEQVRSYDPAGPDAPPEVQLFLIARRSG